MFALYYVYLKPQSLSTRAECHGHPLMRTFVVLKIGGDGGGGEGSTVLRVSVIRHSCSHKLHSEFIFTSFGHTELKTTVLEWLNE